MTTSWRRAQLKALTAAQRTLKRHDVDPSRRVDIFGLIRAEGLVLAFRPLPRLAGAYQPIEGGRAGVMINSNHPLSKQRYTAGHELGHHLLEHGAQFDAETEISQPRSTVSLAEVEAEAFAGAILMPRQLLTALSDEFGAAISSPHVCYQASLMAGASYAATAVQARVYDLITEGELSRLLKTTPAKVKRDLAGTPPYAVGAGDVLELSLADDRRVAVRPGDLVLIRKDRVDISSLGPGLQAESDCVRCGISYHRIRVKDRAAVNPTGALEKSFVASADGRRIPLVVELDRVGFYEDDVRGRT